MGDEIRKFVLTEIFQKAYDEMNERLGRNKTWTAKFKIVEKPKKKTRRKMKTNKHNEKGLSN